MVKDPVCGAEVNEGTALKTILGGKTYFFCNKTCKWLFESDPSRYSKPIDAPTIR